VAARKHAPAIAAPIIRRRHETRHQHHHPHTPPRGGARTVLQVQDARLAHVLDLGAHLAHDGLLDARLGARLPPEHRVRPVAHLARPAKLLARHAHVGVVAQARLAQDGELRVLPADGGGVGADAHALVHGGGRRVRRARGAAAGAGGGVAGRAGQQRRRTRARSRAARGEGGGLLVTTKQRLGHGLRKPPRSGNGVAAHASGRGRCRRGPRTRRRQLWGGGWARARAAA
jgi:hypothetical protein